MSTDVIKVLIAQFLTAFADNAVLFVAITMVLQAGDQGSWYVPALQASFLVAFVVLAPWVGPFADSRSKPIVLSLANVIKAVGASLFLFGFDSLLAYAVIGIGAALYSPAKYGVLPELVNEEMLVKANGWIEGSTILAILLGSVFGAQLAENSTRMALAMVLVLYLVSAAVTLLVTRVPAVKEMHSQVLRQFNSMLSQLLSTPRARFSALAVSLFWSAAAVLRVLIVAWAPLALFIHETTEIAKLTMFIALGIALGSFLAPHLVPLHRLRRARLAAYVMGMLIALLSIVDVDWLARMALFAIGVTGGLFVVPINAALQDIGHRSIGSGGAVGIQNFFENLAMLVASGLYAYASSVGAIPMRVMFLLGVVVIIATLLVSWNLPADTATSQRLRKGEV